MNMILRVSELHKAFGSKQVLKGASFEVRAGETVVLLGTNGAGKSTLLRCMLGLETPQQGSVSLLGFDPLKQERRAREAVGYVPDHPDVYPWMNAKQLFQFLKPAYPKWSDERAFGHAAALGCPLNTSFKSMSRGEAAKLMLVAALASSPALVVLDEAFARLAPPVRDEVLEFFVREAPLEGGAALVATHDLDVAARLADRVLFLDKGRLTEAEDLHVSAGASVPAKLRAMYDEQELGERVA